jgi:phosphoglycolate phosphatase-like HAD superfamily hydrolase
VWTGPATRRAFERAVEAVVGRVVDSRAVSFGGKTDPLIAAEILATLPVGDDEIDGHVSSVLAELERAMAVAADDLREGGRVLPGVGELLARLHGRRDVVQSVLTGNVAANARLKVGAFGLDRFLDLEVGAFGSDHADRNQLVPVALRKLDVLRGLRVSPNRVWVVGDTGRDLECARAAGARCVLVATGMVPFEELEPLGADATLRDLSETDAVERLLLAG